jgi:uncharacterized protein (TIGR00661 family)
LRILYGITTHGQGHLNRSAEMIRRLRARGHRVSVLMSGIAPAPYARAVLGEHAFARLPSFVIREGAVDLARSLAALARCLPRRIAAVGEVALSLARERVDLVLSDFEPVSTWAAFLAGAPSAGIAGQYRLTRTDAEGPRAPLERALTRAMIEAWTPVLGRYFAVSFHPAAATRPRTDVVGPIVDERVRALAPRREGFFLAYLYSYAPTRVIAALAPHGRFRVYGLDREERHGAIEFRRTDRAAFLGDLAACEGVILNGSFQTTCEAAALGKPALSIPFRRQYEERLNAFQIERAGLGFAADSLGAAAVGRFVAARPRVLPRAARDGAEEILALLGL